MISDDFAEYWSDICSLPIALITHMVKHAQRQGFCTGEDAHLIAVAMVSMLNQFCYTQLSGDKPGHVDDDACITTLANVFYRTIYHQGGGMTGGVTKPSGAVPEHPASRANSSVWTPRRRGGRAPAGIRARASTTAGSGANPRSR